MGIESLFHYQLLERDVNSKRIEKYGSSDGVTTAELPIWQANTLFMRPTVPDYLNIVSTSSHDSVIGSGARCLSLTGINDDGAWHNVQHSLDGLNVTTTVDRWWSIFRAEVCSAGGGGVHPGLIDSIGGTIGAISAQQVTSSNLLAYIQPHENVTEQCIWQVPSGEHMIIDDVNLNSGQGQTVTFEMITAKWGKPFIHRWQHDHYRTAHTYPVGVHLEGMEQAVILAYSDGGGAVQASASVNMSRYIDRDG